MRDVQLLVGQLRDRLVGELLDLLQLVDGDVENRMTSVDMFDDQKCDGHRRQPPGRRGDLARAARHGVQRRVQDEPPQNTLRDGKGQRNQDQRRKRRHARSRGDRTGRA